MFRRTLGLLGIVVLVAVVAGATTPTRSAQSNHPTKPADRQIVLYSQIANPSGSDAAAQDFETAYDAYDCWAADDFNVTDAAGWNVEQLHTPGMYSTGGGPAAGMQYQLLTNSGGFPGSVICSGLATIVTDVSGDITSALPTACALTTGIKWVAVAARMDFATSGQWYVSTESVTTGSIARWYNPGNGFGDGCTAWNSCDISIPTGGLGFDMSFEVLGAVVPVELQKFDAK